jgi:plasmid stabilization system protein ParE
VIWAPPALADVQRLYRFLAPKNPDAANRAAETIRSNVALLAHQPAVGRPVENMVAGYRDLLIDFGRSGYVVRYRIDGDTVVVLAIRHQRKAGW